MVKTKKDYIYQGILNLAFIVICAAILFPLILTVSASFSRERDIADFGYSIIPRVFSLEAYKFIFNNPASILQAYKVTAIFSLLHTVLSVFMMSCLAFALSKRYLPGKRQISFFVYFTQL